MNITNRQVAGARRRLANRGYERVTDVNALNALPKDSYERADILLPEGYREVWARMKNNPEVE